jgi:hypothetical protein
METFQIILQGQCLEGFDPADVRTALAKLLGQSEAVAGQLLAGGEVVVKSRVDIVTSTRYVEALRAIGVASWVAPEMLDMDVDLAVRLMNTQPGMAAVNDNDPGFPDTTHLLRPVTSSRQSRSVVRQSNVFGWFVLAGTAFALTVGGVALLTSSRGAGKDASAPAAGHAPAQEVPANEAHNPG